MLFVRFSSTMFPFFKKILHLEFENGLNLTQLTPVDPIHSVFSKEPLKVGLRLAVLNISQNLRLNCLSLFLN